jgi:hypothetical protein
MQNLGPTCPPIFIGHLSCTGTSYASTSGSNSYEINLGRKCLIEGLHIVPNKIVPPGFPIEGRTQPDIATRPFHLQVYVKSDQQQSLYEIMSFTVSGGAHWLPVPLPHNTVPVSYLAFHGDFEQLSLIIHGIAVSSRSSDDSMRPMPVPAMGNSSHVSTAVTSEILISNISGDTAETEIAIQTGVCCGLVPHEPDYFAVTRNKGEVDIFSGYSLHSAASLSPFIFSSSSWCYNSPFPLSVVSKLVAEIFAAEPKLSAPFSERLRIIAGLKDYMEQCWKVIPAFNFCCLELINQSN